MTRYYKPESYMPDHTELLYADKDRDREDIIHSWLGEGVEVPDMICEEHPASVWPHGECAGPGMLGVNIFRLWAESAAKEDDKT